MANISLKRKQLITSALSKHLSLDSGTACGISGEDDIKSLYTNVLKTSGNWSHEKENDEVFKWIGFAESFPVDAQACSIALNKLNEELSQKSVLTGNGMKPSETDAIVFSAVYPSVTGLSNPEREQLTHVMRWMDYIQHKEEFGDLFEKIPFEKPAFEPVGARSTGEVETDSNLKKTVQSTKSSEKTEVEQSTKKSTKNSEKFEEEQSTKKSSKSTEKSEVKNKDAGKKVAEKKDPVAKETSEKDKELSVSLLNLQVGLIRKAWKHPSADSLLVEEIDVGEAKVRQVVSGLAKFCTPDELTNRLVVLITNVKPGKLRDVMSEGLVLCASSKDHSVVEPLLPPEGAKIGERVSFAGIDGKPEDVLNPKKKQLEKITPNLFTDEKGVATFKGIPFMTSAGPITSSIPKAGIK
ncbi:probable methionine--tRNA ligase [Euphorbia lathyris]|uniref:probable methionine--tRNA ligase n=1 Tax=Euphorbia lathyris TaxID=212925 RepID=UPI003313A004